MTYWNCALLCQIISVQMNSGNACFEAVCSSVAVLLLGYNLPWGAYAYVVCNVTYLNHCPQQAFSPIFLLFYWYPQAQFAILRKCQSCPTPLYLTLLYYMGYISQMQTVRILFLSLYQSTFACKTANCPVNNQGSARSPVPKVLWTSVSTVFSFPTAVLKACFSFYIAYFSIQNVKRQCGRTILQIGNLKSKLSL